jgi:hypothetical protein
MNGREQQEPFCSNPDCLLHVRSDDAGIIGTGNWAELPDGTIIGRGSVKETPTQPVRSRTSASSRLDCVAGIDAKPTVSDMRQRLSMFHK